MLAPGEIVDGKYRVVRLLGEGGMGAVYEGHNLRIDRRVAIKVMHASISSQRQHVARFEREAQAAARIGSSHIVDVFDLGNLPSGDRFMVMEFLDGDSLMTRLRKRTKLPVLDAVGICVQLLEGLAKVHDAGILHRDLKPANVFLVRGENGGDFVKILDFGICKIVREKMRSDISTGVGDILGTPSYMSPEQIEHGPRHLDARADLYAVGVILYRALSGRLPFKAKNLVDLLMLLRGGRADPVENVVDIDARLAAIVNRAIEWDREARYQTARELQRALLDWMSASNRVNRLLTEFLEVEHVEAAIEPTPPRAPSLPAPKPPPKKALARARLPALHDDRHRDEAVTKKNMATLADEGSARTKRRAGRRSFPTLPRTTQEDIPIDLDEDAATIPKLGQAPRGPRRA